MAADGGVPDSPLATVERGAESSGEFWAVYRITESGKPAHALVVIVAPGVRRKIRLPKELASVDDRKRWARGAAKPAVHYPPMRERPRAP